MSGRIYRVNELVTDTDNLDLIGDISRYYVATKTELPFKLYVAGSENYGNGLEKYKKPHFHVIIEDGSNIEKMRINIPTIKEWSDNKKLEVVFSTISDYGDILDKISKWLDIKVKTTLGETNKLRDLIFTWNNANEENKNVDFIK